ncbi:SAM-dependent methyltransferase [Natronorubrum sp. DTA28]|uniref:SAM-dependent methyltransferase n=1 Tax=Natronorubrum sp. DTA28 TaxID=3447019 RepID=UPI003F865D70
MGLKESSTEGVESMYSNLVGVHKRIWKATGNQSIHYGYYEDDDDDMDTASTRMMELVADTVDIDRHSRVLVLGCGAGEDAIWIADEFDAEVVGVDLIEDQIELAREYAWKRNVEDLVTFHTDDFHELSSASDGSFDVVWALESVSHSDNLEAVVDQCDRVLSEQGQIVFADWFAPDDSMSDSEEKRLRKLDNLMRQWTDTLDEVESTVAAGGFDDFTAVDVTDGVRPAVSRRYKSSFIMIPFYTVASAIGLASAELRDVTKASYHMHVLVRDDVMRYYILSAS